MSGPGGLGAGHDEVVRSLAAYVLGALDPAERTLVEAHLAECRRCRDEVAALAPIPGLLARVDRADLDRPAIDVAGAAAVRARAGVARLRRSRNAWRALAVAAVLAAIAFASVALWPAGGDGADAIPLTATSDLGLEAWASATPRSWGTELAIGCDEIPDSPRYTLVAVAADGRREQAAAWGPSEEYHIVVEGATSIPLAELDHVVVLDDAGRELFRAAV